MSWPWTLAWWLGCIGAAIGLALFAWGLVTGKKAATRSPHGIGGEIMSWIEDYRQRNGTGGRVFQTELREWPEVYTLLSGNGYIMKAPHAAPDRAVWTGRMPLITGVATVIALISWAVAGSLVEVVVGGLVAGVASVPVWRSVLEKTVTLNFDKDLIAWRTPEGKNGTVELQGDFAANVQLPHRLAQEEMRVHQNYLRRRPAAKTAPKSVYQVASEVIIFTGVSKREWLTVAAIADDESGEKAYRLKTAIEFMRDVVKAEAKKVGRTAPPSLPAAGRPAAPEDERYE